MQQTNKDNKQTHSHRWQHGGYQRGRELEEEEEGKKGQIYGNRRRPDFGWWAHNPIYRWCVIKLYTWNLHNVIKQCYPINLLFKKEWEHSCFVLDISRRVLVEIIIIKNKGRCRFFSEVFIRVKKFHFTTVC